MDQNKKLFLFAGAGVATGVGLIVTFTLCIICFVCCITFALLGSFYSDYDFPDPYYTYPYITSTPTPTPYLFKPTPTVTPIVDIKPTILWSKLVKYQNATCERRKGDIYTDQYSLESYPTINSADIDEFRIVTSLRNQVASTTAYDVVDFKDNIIFTVSDITGRSYALKSKAIAFYGSTPTNCDKVFGIYDMDTKREIIFKDAENFGSGVATSGTTVEWSNKGNYVLTGRLFGAKEYRLNIYDKNGNLYKKVDLKGGSFEDYCLNVCVGTEVYLDENTQTIKAKSLISRSAEPSQSVYTIMEFDLTGKLLNQGSLEFKPYVTLKETCTQVKFSAKKTGTALFCINYLV